MSCQINEALKEMALQGVVDLAYELLKEVVKNGTCFYKQDNKHVFLSEVIFVYNLAGERIGFEFRASPISTEVDNVLHGSQ